MNISDPIADMLTRVRNASRARHVEVAVPASRTKREIARILKTEGFIAEGYRVVGFDNDSRFAKVYPGVARGFL